MRSEHVVVVGAGIGGLTSALLLASQGLRVTVIEKADGVGGKVRQLPISGTAIDAGPTVFTLRDVFDDIFAAVGESLDDHLTIRRADRIARHAWSTAEQLDLFADVQASEAAINDFAGAEAARGFRSFTAEARRIYEILDEPFLRNSRVYPPGLMWRIGLWRIGELHAIRPYESLWKMLGEHFRDPRLRQLFGRYTTYCGSSPFKAPATLMLIAHAEAKGVWLIDGGMSALAAALEGLAHKNGASFRFGQPVQKIETNAGRASAVILASGERIAADCVILNADPAALAAGLLGPDVRRAARPVKPGARSLSAFTWLMKARTGGFALDRHNVFFSRDYPAEFAALHAGKLADQPTAYVCAMDRPGEPDSDRLQVIVNAPANGDTHHYTPEEIERCSMRMLERLAACGLEVEPLAPPRVVTPNDYERLFPSTGGALYGRASHGWAASFLRQSARTRIPGLYCAGGSTHPGAGVPMAALSGRLAAAALLKDRRSTARFLPAAMPGGMSTPSPAAVPTA